MFRQVDTVEAMEELGWQLSQACEGRLRIFLQGDLGVGKTTLVRGFLRGLGYTGKVKSPTYTLVEPYELPDIEVFHFDLYRLSDPGELEGFGFRDYFDEHSVVLLEWPEKAASLLDEPDLLIVFDILDDSRTLEFQSKSAAGAKLVSILQ